MKLHPLTLLLGSMLLPVSTFGAAKEPYQGSRIFWDVATETTVFDGAIYSRMIELHDGSLMACAESGGIVIARSYDKGATWSAPVKIAFQPDRVGLCVPDIAQLSDGTIIVGYNPRPSTPWSEERKFGIMAVRSIDNGETWSDPITIFTASHDGGEGCWEPSFLELPSGELQCYFANEYEFPYSGEQCISLSRSFDKGLSWGAPERVSFRAGSRDGMPVPVLLEDTGEIVVIIEDNGWGHKSFVATTVRTSLDSNWHDGFVDGGSPDRQRIFMTTPSRDLISAAPYLRVLPNGETVASYMGNEGRPQDGDDYRDMFVEVGDSRAMNFKGRTKPFNMDASHHSLWNSVAVIDNDVVVAVGSVGEIGKGTSIAMIKGFPKNGVDIPYSNVTLDGSQSDGETWWHPSAEQFVMGAVSRNRSTVDFAYDDSNLYFIARITDPTHTSDGNKEDFVRILIDAGNVCGTLPGIGMFDLTFYSDGSVAGKSGVSRGWKTMNESQLAGTANVVASNENGYTIEGAIPLATLGLDSRNLVSPVRMTFEIADSDGTNIVTETVPDAHSSQSWSWMEVRFHDNGESGVTTLRDRCAGSRNASVIRQNGIVTVSNDREISHIELFDSIGRSHGKIKVNAEASSFPTLPLFGIGLITYADGSSESIKF